MLPINKLIRRDQSKLCMTYGGREREKPSTHSSLGVSCTAFIITANLLTVMVKA